MKVKKLSELFIICALLAGFLCLFINRKNIIVSSADVESIENFDLILTKGQSVQSRLVNLLDFSVDQGYTHIGIVCKTGNRVSVLHATPDGTKRNCIRYDDFQTFINLSSVCGYRILRLKNFPANLRCSLTQAVEKFRKARIPFDYSFNNREHRNIYCSELIYLAFTESGLLQAKSFNLEKPIGPDKFLNLTELFTVTDRETAGNQQLTGLDTRH
jgi:hypothetical protein